MTHSFLFHESCKNLRILEITCFISSLVTFVVSDLNGLTCRSFVMQSCSL